MNSSIAVSIKRVALNQNETFGVLMVNNMPVAVTLERPWLKNYKDVSCIPAGFYNCQRINIRKGLMPGSETFHITNVPMRSEIVFHVGNTIKDTRGCILLGTSFGRILSNHGISNSRVACTNFMQNMIGINNFNLEIINV